MACEKNKGAVVQAACRNAIPPVASSNGFTAGRINAQPTNNPPVIISSKDKAARPAFVPFGPAQRLVGNSYLPAENVPPVDLTPSRVGIRVGERSGKPVIAVVQNGQIAMRPNGTPTGLALVPGIVLPDNPGDPLREDTRQWWVAHVNSGKILSHQGYSDGKEAWRLAGLLAQMDWDRSEDEFSASEIVKANTTIALFDRALDEFRQSSPTAPRFMPGPNSISVFRAETLPTSQSLVSQLLAHEDHGLVRVLEDRGSVLFVVDASGDRHEIERGQLQLPTEADYEAAKVIMPVDPATLVGETCVDCGTSADQAQPGVTWYKMRGEPFCKRCGLRNMYDEGYSRPQEVGVEY